MKEKLTAQFEIRRVRFLEGQGWTDDEGIVIHTPSPIEVESIDDAKEHVEYHVEEIGGEYHEWEQVEGRLDMQASEPDEGREEDAILYCALWVNKVTTSNALT